MKTALARWALVALLIGAPVLALSQSATNDPSVTGAAHEKRATQTPPQTVPKKTKAAPPRWYKAKPKHQIETDTTLTFPTDI